MASLELVRIVDPQDFAPGLSPDFVKACGELNSALDKFRDAQIAELKYQLQYMAENFAKANISDYGISDPMSNIESLVYQLLPDKPKKK